MTIQICSINQKILLFSSYVLKKQAYAATEESREQVLRVLLST